VKEIRKIKQMDFLVKLDSNGSNPSMLKRLFDQKLLDFVAMDLKHRQEKHQRHSNTTNRNTSLHRIIHNPRLSVIRGIKGYLTFVQFLIP